MSKAATKLKESDTPSVLQPCSPECELRMELTFPDTLLQKLRFCKEVVQQLPDANANANGWAVWKWCIGENMIKYYLHQCTIFHYIYRILIISNICMTLSNSIIEPTFCKIIATQEIIFRFIKLNVQKINDLIQFMYVGFVI